MDEASELEDRLVRLLGETVHDLPVPVAVMVAAAGRRGRRLRRRRRAAQGAATAAVVAWLVCGSALLDGRARPAASPTARPADPVGRDLLGTLAALLPPGASLRRHSDPAQQHLDPAAEAGISVAYDGGHGPVDVTVLLYGPRAGDFRPGCEVSSRPTGRRTGCGVTEVNPGVEQLTEVYPDGYDIRVTRPDGVRVDLLVRRQGSNPAPALTLAQWQEIARSPRWTLPAGAGGPQPGTGS